MQRLGEYLAHIGDLVWPQLYLRLNGPSFSKEMPAGVRFRQGAGIRSAHVGCRFDFLGVVEAFDDALAADPALDRWILMDALLDAHLASSGEEALGGELAGRYAASGSLAGLTLNTVQSVLGDPKFGSAAQPLASPAGLQDGAPKLG